MYYSLDSSENIAVSHPAAADFAIISPTLSLGEHLAQRRAARQAPSPSKSKTPTARKAPKRRAKTTPAIAWLRKLTCSLVFGEGTPVGVRPSMTKEALIGSWNSGRPLPKLANYDLLDHFAGEETFYFFGNGATDADATLVMIDIDVQKSKGLGSPAGALAFAEHLEKAQFPDLYFERSTGGKGIHAYFLLWKKGVNASGVNEALRRIEAWLRAEAEKVNADIELVEIKGTCPIIEFDRGCISSVKYGSFAKLPREAHRFAEWQATTVINWLDVRAGKYDLPEVIEPQPDAVAKPRIVTVEPKKLAPVAGSLSGKCITEEDLAAIPQYEEMYQQWTGGVNLKARRHVVTAHDFAVAVMLMRWFSANGNADESLPWRRAEEMWKGLYDAGDVQRPANHHRWKAVRDFLSEKGHINWIDHRYEYGGADAAKKKPVSGKKKKGTACKWRLMDKFQAHLESVRRSSASVNAKGEASFVDTRNRNLIPARGSGHYLVPQPFPISVEREQRFWIRAYEACETLCAA